MFDAILNISSPPHSLYIGLSMTLSLFIPSLIWSVLESDFIFSVARGGIVGGAVRGQSAAQAKVYDFEFFLVALLTY